MSSSTTKQINTVFCDYESATSVLKFDLFDYSIFSDSDKDMFL